MFLENHILPKTFKGPFSLRIFAPKPQFLCLNERGDQGLSIGGKHDLVQHSERWQIAFENLIFSSK